MLKCKLLSSQICVISTFIGSHFFSSVTDIRASENKYTTSMELGIEVPRPCDTGTAIYLHAQSPLPVISTSTISMLCCFRGRPRGLGLELDRARFFLPPGIFAAFLLRPRAS